MKGAGGAKRRGLVAGPGEDSAAVAEAAAGGDYLYAERRGEERRGEGEESVEVECITPKGACDF